MSDPVSSMDVEDVLSSIRRLVSEEAKGGETGEEPIEAPNDAAIPAKAGASLNGPDEHAGTPPSNDLAPDLPVEPETAGTAGPQMSFRHQAAQARTGADQKLVLTSALRVADKATETRDDAETDGGAAEQNLRTPRPHLRSVDTAEAPGLGDARPDDAHPHDSQLRDTPNSRADSGEEAGEAGSGAFEFAPDDTLFERAKRAMAAVKESKAEPQAYVFNKEPEDDTGRAGAKSGSDPDQSDASDLAEFTAALESAVAAAPEAGSDSIARSDSGDIRPASPFAERAGAIADEPAKPEPPAVNFTDEEESILDEDTLRDLVSEMVREELQGELGDRITRNVRKLVRREIQRALASREFE